VIQIPLNKYRRFVERYIAYCYNRTIIFFIGRFGGFNSIQFILFYGNKTDLNLPKTPDEIGETQKPFSLPPHNQQTLSSSPNTNPNAPSRLASIQLLL
jgi:hypothetical protein